MGNVIVSPGCMHVYWFENLIVHLFFFFIHALSPTLKPLTISSNERSRRAGLIGYSMPSLNAQVKCTLSSTLCFVVIDLCVDEKSNCVTVAQEPHSV